MLDTEKLEEMTPREKLEALADELQGRDGEDSMTELELIIECLTGLLDRAQEVSDHSHRIS